MATIGFTRSLLRPPSGETAERVTFTELFFDLVFVFAVTQVSHILVDHQSAINIVYTVILGAAVWWVWVDTTWITNWLNPEHGWVVGMLIALMASGLLMSSAIPQAFSDKALLFAISLVVLQLGRHLFAYLALARHRAAHARNVIRMTVWLAGSSVLWIVGALVPDYQLGIWLAAILLDYAGPAARFWIPRMGSSPVESWDVSGAHMAERVSLFMIIALGESIIVSGSTFSALAPTAEAVGAFLAAFVGAVLLWLLYFSHSQREGSDYIDSASQTGLVARAAYTYVPLLMVLGVISTAVADRAILESPAEANAWSAGFLCAGTAIYLLGNVLFRRSTGGGTRPGHLVGIAALAALFLLHPILSSLAISWIANVVLLGAVIVDEVAVRRARHVR